VQVVANPYDPEYGKLSGAVATVDTRVSDFDKFRFRIQNFMPRFRKRDGTIMGIESSTPRLVITGPLKRGRLALTQSFEYRYVRTPVETLPPLHRDTRLESFDSYTQVDLNLSERQSASSTLAFYPHKSRYYGLNTRSHRSQRHRTSGKEAISRLFPTARLDVRRATCVQVSFKKFDFTSKPTVMIVPTVGGDHDGGFFNRQNRDSGRIEWQEIYTPLAAAGLGRHQLKIGFNFVRNAYDGSQDFRTVEVLRLSGRVAERIDFAPARAVAVRQREYTGFLLDKWTVHPRATLDLGLRFDRDSISGGGGHLAPRVGLAFTPFRNNRTVSVEGRLFYDKIPLTWASSVDTPCGPSHDTAPTALQCPP
jgi:outer membrane receptor protein involved in Fe transport